MPTEPKWQTHLSVTHSYARREGDFFHCCFEQQHRHWIKRKRNKHYNYKSKDTFYKNSMSYAPRDTSAVFFVLTTLAPHRAFFQYHHEADLCHQAWTFLESVHFPGRKLLSLGKHTALTNCTVPFKHLSQGFVEKCKPLGKFINSSLGHPYWWQINTFHKSKLFNAKMIIRKLISYIISYYHNIKL